MGYDRNELITIGERFPAEALLDWTSQIVQSARQDLSRLRNRGIQEQALRQIEASREEVRRIYTQERDRRETSNLAARRREAMQQAIEWREEVCGLAKAVFDSEPEVLSRFHPGVKISRSLPKIIWETGRLMGVLREHHSSFEATDVDGDLLTRGEEVLHDLEESQNKIGEEHEQIPPSLLDLYHALGVLYTKARYLCRIAHVEFRNESDRLARYSYDPLRRQERKPEVRKYRTPVGAGR